MTKLLCELHLWSLKENYIHEDAQIGFHSYHEKVNHSENIYNEERQQFDEGRDITLSPSNKRPERLRDNIKEVEELLSQFSFVRIRWRNRQVLQIILSNATVLTFMVSGHCGDIDRILIDKSLVGKLSSEIVCDAFLTDQFFIASNTSSCRIDYVYFIKRPPLIEAAKRIDRLSSWEPKVVQVDIPGPIGRRLDRHFSMNTTQDMILVSWSLDNGEAWPWSPMSSDRERSNLTILTVHGPMVEVLLYTKIETDPLFAEFSQLQPHYLYTLEQNIKNPTDVSVRTSKYKVVRGEIQMSSTVSLPLKSTVVCQARSPQEDQLLLGLSDASLVMYNEHKTATLVSRAAAPPVRIAWHPNGTVVVVASVRADIQIFDRALTPIYVQLVSEEPAPEPYLKLSKLFKRAPSLREAEWCPFPPYSSESMTSYMEAFLLQFNGGPIGLLQFHLGARSQERFSSIGIIHQYLKHEQIDEAIDLLASMNWDSQGASCFSCLSAIMNQLLRLPLNASREAQLEAALATFYTPRPVISDATILEYREPISHLARRFFHHLLRYIRFDKAFLLAVDIGARDLFMDIHYMAADKGEITLAEVAKKKAQQIEFDDLEDTLDVFEEDVQAAASTPHSRGGHSNESLSRTTHQNSSRQRDNHSLESRNATEMRVLRNGHGTRPQFSDGSYPDLGDLRLQDDLIRDYTAALWDSPAAASLIKPRMIYPTDSDEQ